MDDLVWNRVVKAAAGDDTTFKQPPRSPRTRQIRCVQTWHAAEGEKDPNFLAKYDDTKIWWNFSFPCSFPFRTGLYKIPKLRMWFFIEAIYLIMNFIVALSQNLVVVM